MKKIAVITFHSSYNHGSNLQAYALQEYVNKISKKCDYKIINLRTNIQKEMYKSIFEKKGLKNFIKKIVFFYERKQLIVRKNRFEDFINNSLNVTKEYNSLEDIVNDKLDFDYYISGSDQLWNINAKDFDWSNFLEFVKEGKRISYAASFGSDVQKMTDDEKNRMKEDLLKYDYLSVRESGSFDNVLNLTGKEPDINVDPTMLLTRDDWFRLVGKKRLIKSDYIFFYNLKGKKYTKIAKIISKKLKLPVVITQRNSKIEIINGFKKRFDAGPKEFLNLLYYSKVVLSSSFHGTVFSIIFNKPFFAINADKDFRLNHILSVMKLSNRSIHMNDCEEKVKNVFNINFDEANRVLKKEREKSKKYLKKALDL